MKRLISLCLCAILLVSIAGCNNNAASPTEPSGTTSTTVPATTVNPYTKYDGMMAAYDASNTDYPIENIIFKDESGCYIITANEKVYPFFQEGATESSLIGESAGFSLHYAPSLELVMVAAMQNAWNQYNAKCAEDRTEVYVMQLYLFECQYFDGVFALGYSDELKRDLVLEGNNCGTFGPFTIYVPENAGQSQQGSMTDGEIKVLIKHAYSKFVTQAALDDNIYESIEYYVFELNGQYYRYADPLERLDSGAITELAMDSTFDGWRIYLPALDEVIPTYDVFEAAYTAFTQEAAMNSKKYKEITEYVFQYENAYYTVDEWLNVLTVDESRIGKKASETDFDGIAIYKMK